MATNLKAILDAIAAGPLLPATLNAAKHTGAESIRKTYPQAPNSTPMTPAIVMLPDTGEIIESGGGTYSETHEVDIWYVGSFRPNDWERQEAQRQLWVGVLSAALLAKAARLALTASVSIKSALPTTYEFDTITYAGKEHPGIRWRVSIVIRDIAVPA